jgi:hypothetical protein
MRKANSEMLKRKLKAEKDCKNMTVKLMAQKAKSKAEEAVVIDRMRLTCEREIAVAVSDATVHLANNLKKSKRGVMGLQHTLNKSEVYSFLPRDPKCEALAIFGGVPCLNLSFLLFYFLLQVQNNILVQNLVHSALKINEMENILKKVQA